MRLLAKFNIVLILVFGIGIGTTGYVARQFLDHSAREQVIEQARLMMGAAGGMRTYTSREVGPLLADHQRRINTFLAQTVPAYSATQVFNYLRTSYPAYTYKEATLNPTNPRDRAVDWEADVVETFRNHADRDEVIGERATPEGESLFLAHPIKVTPPCLECHDQPAKAPAAMLKVYGRNNGFAWKPGEVVGAQIVSVPSAVPVTIADRAFRTLMISLGGVSLLTLILLDLGLVLIVVRPVIRLSEMADQISKGNLRVPELPVKGNDEISQLARSFNRMYVSLAKAIRMLDDQPQ